MKQLPIHQELQLLREQLKRLESQIHQQNMYTDITIDNKTNRELQLTINLEEHDMTFESKVELPHRSSVTHHILNESTQDRSINKNQSLPIYHKYRSQKPKETSAKQALGVRLQGEQLSSTRLQRKFQPIPSATRTIREQEATKEQQLQGQQGGQLQYGQEGQKAGEGELGESEFREGGKNEGESIVQSNYVAVTDRKHNQILIEESRASKILQQTVAPIPLPFSIQNKSNRELPNPLHTQNKQQYKIPPQGKEHLNWNLHTLQRSALKDPKQPNWKIDRISPIPKRSEIVLAKTYKEQAVRKKSIKEQGQKRANERLKTQNVVKCSKSRNKQNLSAQKKLIRLADSRKADDLFEVRKKECLNKIDKQRQLINTMRQAGRQRSLSTKQVQQTGNPLVQEVTTRLYPNRKKTSPCTRYQRYSQSIEKQHFNQLVNESTFVSRYLSSTEREVLFQRLRASQDSMSVWPMKIMNEAYYKLKRVTQPPYHPS